MSDTDTSRPPPASDTQPIAVHVTGVDEGVNLGPAKKKRRKRTRFETYVLTANDPVQCILPDSADRVSAYVQAIDNDIILGPTKGVAGATVNTVAGVPNPNGAYIPKADTGPYLIEGTNPVYAGVTTTGSNSRVTVVETYWSPE